MSKTILAIPVPAEEGGSLVPRGVGVEQVGLLLDAASSATVCEGGRGGGEREREVEEEKVDETEGVRSKAIDLERICIFLSLFLFLSGFLCCFLNHHAGDHHAASADEIRPFSRVRTVKKAHSRGRPPSAGASTRSRCPEPSSPMPAQLTGATPRRRIALLFLLLWRCRHPINLLSTWERAVDGTILS
jgi:hypothetical protein